MKDVSRNLSWVFVGVTGLLVLVTLLMSAVPAAESPKEFGYRAFGQLPVQDHGRVKPIDTLARVSLMIISGKQEWSDEAGNTRPATQWLLDILTGIIKNRPDAKKPIAGPSGDIKAYRVVDAELKKRLKLDDTSGVLFSFNDIYKNLGPEGMQELAQEGEGIDPQAEGLSDRERALALLVQQISWHTRFSGWETTHKVFRIDNEQVLSLLGLEARQGFRYGLNEILPRVYHLQREAERAKKIDSKSRGLFDVKVLEVYEHVTLYVGLARGSAETLSLIAPEGKGAEYRTMPEAMADLAREEDERGDLSGHANAESFRRILVYYAKGEVDGFNKEVASYGTRLTKIIPADMDRVSSEAGFNDFAPFYRCMLLYVFVFLVACVSWMWRDPVITWYAFGLMAFTVLLHTWALAMRMYIQGRPPVTNLYSSAVFIGWACVLIALAIELKYRNALACAVASMTGFATLIIAHYLSASGDTLEMMQAVLDTNFWLATHVTTVTIGYSATFVAGMFGLIFLWMMMITHCLSSLREGGAVSLGQGVVFFLCAMAAGVFAVTFAAGIQYGVWYGSGAGSGSKFLVQGLAGLTALTLAYPLWLCWHRWKQAAGTAPAGLPAGATFLERLALTEETRRVLVWMMYGTVCFATLFSFVGTVLGGIWADYSWGRFWGWDPKENGALLIVIMNALILHARWGGMVKDRGMAALTLVGNMVTMWSWFGTNQLGIGLHAYGFNNALVLLCKWFWISQVALIGLAMLPLRNWRDYKPTPLGEAAAPPKAQPAPRAKGRRGSTKVQPA